MRYLCTALRCLLSLTDLGCLTDILIDIPDEVAEMTPSSRSWILTVTNLCLLSRARRAQGTSATAVTSLGRWRPGPVNLNLGEFLFRVGASLFPIIIF